MKRKVFFGLLTMVLLASLLSCAAFVDNTYKSLGVAGTSYDVAMKSVRVLQDQGKITQAQRDTINKFASIYYVAYQGAIDALEIYMNTKAAADKDKLTAALTSASTKLGDLLNYINTIKGVTK